MTGSRRILCTAALTLSVSVAACGGSSEKPAKAPPLPAGFKATGTKYFSFGHPSAWSAEVRRPRTQVSFGEVVADALGPAGTTGKHPEVLVGATPKYRSGLGGLLVVNDTSSRARFPQRKVISRRDVKVAGAGTGKLIESSIPATDGTPLRTFDLLTVSRKGTAVSMFAVAPEADVDAARIREILRTLRVIA
jgi:hypothetical protein